MHVLFAARFMRKHHCCTTQSTHTQQVSSCSGATLHPDAKFCSHNTSAARDRALAVVLLPAGLADFMVAAYMGQQQYASWARSLFSGLNDEQIAHVGYSEDANMLFYASLRHRQYAVPESCLCTHGFRRRCCLHHSSASIYASHSCWLCRWMELACVRAQQAPQPVLP